MGISLNESQIESRDNLEGVVRIRKEKESKVSSTWAVARKNIPSYT